MVATFPLVTSIVPVQAEGDPSLGGGSPRPPNGIERIQEVAWLTRFEGRINSGAGDENVRPRQNDAISE